MSELPMRCRKCRKPMYREDIDMGNGPEEAWRCPDRLDGNHGEWLSMPVFVTRFCDEDYERFVEAIENPAPPSEALRRAIQAAEA